MCIYISVHINSDGKCICMYMQVSVCVCMYVCVSVCLCVCLFVCDASQLYRIMYLVPYFKLTLF